MLKNTAGRRIEKRLNSHRVSLSAHGDERGDSILQSFLDVFHEFQQKPMLSSLNVLSGCTSSFSSVYGRRGLVGLEDEHEDYRAELSTSAELLKWSFRLGCRFHFNLPPSDQPGFAPQFTVQAIKGTVLLPYSFLHNDQGHQEEIWRYLAASFHRLGPKISEDFWKVRRFEPLFLHLYSQVHRLKCPFDISDFNLGEYQPLLDGWRDDARCSEALVQACDYHLQRMENTRSWDAEFHEIPFDLFPVEIHAFNLLREWMGLGKVEVPHPLMDFCPVWAPTDPLPEVLPLIATVKEKISQLAPNDGL